MCYWLVEMNSFSVRLDSPGGGGGPHNIAKHSMYCQKPAIAVLDHHVRLRQPSLLPNYWACMSSRAVQ